MVVHFLFSRALIDVMPHNYITCCSVFHFKSVMSSWYMLKLSFVFSPKKKLNDIYTKFKCGTII